MEPSDDKNLDYQQGTISTVELHDAIRREDPLQPGGRGTVGVTVVALTAMILIFGGGQLFSRRRRLFKVGTPGLQALEFQCRILDLGTGYH